MSKNISKKEYDERHLDNREKNVRISDTKEISEATFPLTGVSAQFGFLLGDILTIIDASISDKQQNKALKDLIKNKFYNKLDWIRRIATKDFNLVSGECQDSAIPISEKEVEKQLIGK